MKISLDKISNVVSKIAELTADERPVVGTMFKAEQNVLRVCHSNGHKSYVEDLSVESEEGDLTEKFVINSEELIKVIRSFQSSGSVKVSDVQITFNKNLGIAVFGVEQFMENMDEDGNVIGTIRTGSKVKEIGYNLDMTKIEVSILNRVNYDELLNTTGDNVFKRNEIVDKLDKTAVEKGKIVYISAVMQTVFVYNTAYATEVPFERKIVTDSEIEELKSELQANGTYSEDTFAKEVDKLSRVINISGALTQNNARTIANILGRSKAEDVEITAGDNKAINFVVNGEDESFAISVETAVDNGLVVKQFKKSREDSYNKIQLVFIRECLTDLFNTVSDEKIDTKELKFEMRNDGMVMTVRNQGANKSNAETLVYNVADTGYDFSQEHILISCKSILAALKQLKTKFVAMDLSEIMGLRLSEVNESKWNEAYNEVRAKTAEKCASLGTEFDPETTPSDKEILLASRDKYLETRQYLIAQK